MGFYIDDVFWKIIFVPAYSPYLRRSDGSYTLGMTDRGTKCIYIANNLYGYLLRKVLAHEICHAEIMTQDIDLDIEEEELLCDFVATFGSDIVSLTDRIFRGLKGRIA